MTWASAATAARLECAPGSAASSSVRRTCTVFGLTPATGYEFQVRAFQVPATGDTVFGGLSNIGRGGTIRPNVAIAMVTVSPASAVQSVGQAKQYAAVLKDASGNQIAGPGAVWSSSNPAVASVDASGLVTARAAGSATITASVGGRTGVAVVTVSPGSSWPNEPSGFSEVTNQAFDALNAAGWSLSSASGQVSIVSDGDAPASASNVIQFRYPAGYSGGGAPGTYYYSHPPYRDVYAGFYWKPSSSWQNHPSNVNKIAFWQTETWGSSLDLQMYGPAPYHLHVVTQFPGATIRLPPNVHDTPIALGKWHRIEWHVKYATAGGADGVVEWWLDGELQGRYTDVRTPADRGFVEYQISPTWGGLGGVKSTDDSYSYDHLKISRR
jgi:hypothetical protein